MLAMRVVAARRVFRHATGGPSPGSSCRLPNLTASRAAVLIPCLFVGVRRVSPVLRVGLSAAGLASTSFFVDVLVIVVIEIVVVNGHIAVAPIAISPVVRPCATHGNGRSPS